MNIWWPDIFTKKDFKYEGVNEEDEFKNAIADGLVGWGNCMLGSKESELPKNFGWGMAKIARITKTTATSEELMGLAKSLDKKGDKE